MTKEHLKKIRQAIRRAKGPRSCRYFVEGDLGREPLCVIAQLMVIEGIKLPSSTNNMLAITCLPYHDDQLRKRGYVVHFLREIQRVWDNREIRSVDERRKRMRELLRTRAS